MTTIKKIELFPLNVPQIEPFRIALDTIYDAENVVVKMTTADGGTGWGECSPFQAIHGETQATCLAIGKKMAELLTGKNPTHIEANYALLDGYIPNNYCIKSAFDMALYDLASQAAGLPLYAFLGGQNRGVLQTDMTVGIDSASNMAAKAQRFQEQGFYAIKVKLGTTLEEDVERIKQIRNAIGYDTPIRIDANQGWDAATAIRALRALESYRIEYCEAPIPRRHRLDLPRVRNESPIPIMADESLFDHFDALHLVRTEAVDYFNIKLGKSGGILNALKISAIAESAGIRCQVGCFSETRLGITALAHFVMARKVVTHCDMDSPLMLTEDPVMGGIRYQDGGRIQLEEATGLGASLSGF